MKLPMVLACICLVFVGCASAATPHDPVGVVRAEIDAINKGQSDTAANLFASDGQLIVAGGQPKGRTNIRAFIIGGLIKLKTHAEIN